MKRFLLAMLAIVPGAAQAQSIATITTPTMCTEFLCASAPAPINPVSYTMLPGYPGNGGHGLGSQFDISVALITAYINQLNAMKAPQLTQSWLDNYYRQITLNGTGTEMVYNPPAVQTQIAFGGGTPPVTIAAVAAVPEPASWAMMILGLGMMGAALRRRNVGYGTRAARVR